MIKKLAGIFMLMIFSLSFVQGQETKTENGIISKVENWYEDHMNYGSITLLMAVESSFIPFPSEIVIPPAAYIAGKKSIVTTDPTSGNNTTTTENVTGLEVTTNTGIPASRSSSLNIYLIVLFGTLGALIGAYVNYFLAFWLGRPILMKFADSKLGKMLLLSGEKIEKAEAYFNTKGNISTFVGRLIPGIRQLISIPAGLSGMHLGSFTLYTFLGAVIWNSILALIGYLAQGQSDMINKYSHEIGIIFLAIVAVVVLIYIFKVYKANKK